jgi:hypothetical protein
MDCFGYKGQGMPVLSLSSLYFEKGTLYTKLGMVSLSGSLLEEMSVIPPIVRLSYSEWETVNSYVEEERIAK